VLGSQVAETGFLFCHGEGLVEDDVWEHSVSIIGLVLFFGFCIYVKSF
jgi:hypothetical protein